MSIQMRPAGERFFFDWAVVSSQVPNTKTPQSSHHLVAQVLALSQSRPAADEFG